MPRRRARSRPSSANREISDAAATARQAGYQKGRADQRERARLEAGYWFCFGLIAGALLLAAALRVASHTGPWL